MNEPVIFLPETLAKNALAVIRAAADRGTFKLEEFGAVHAVAAQLAEAVKVNRVEPEAIEAEAAAIEPTAINNFAHIAASRDEPEAN
ncbi:hypothetical protein [Mycoplana ramosa]|uniref:Uncharacterized protein n=1 Tax=Mycoplana ramosa TaxID=40837 RepID=A0ABW3YQA3_MYCRA